MPMFFSALIDSGKISPESLRARLPNGDPALPLWYLCDIHESLIVGAENRKRAMDAYTRENTPPNTRR